MGREDFNDFNGALDPDGFEPTADLLDPDGLQGPQKAQQRPTAAGSNTMVTLKVVNATAAKLTAQWFAPGTGIAAMVNDSTINAFNAATPETVVGAANLNSTFYFDRSGNLITQDAAGAKMTQSCNEIPYRQLLNTMFAASFKLTRVRMTVTTDPQIDEQITFKQKTMFGKVGYQDSVTPRQWFNPNQFQGKILDIPYNFVFDQERSFSQPVIAGETVTYAVIISGVRRNFK